MFWTKYNWINMDMSIITKQEACQTSGAAPRTGLKFCRGRSSIWNSLTWGPQKDILFNWWLAALYNRGTALLLWLASTCAIPLGIGNKQQSDFLCGRREEILLLLETRFANRLAPKSVHHEDAGLVLPSTGESFSPDLEKSPLEGWSLNWCELGILSGWQRMLLSCFHILPKCYVVIGDILLKSESPRRHHLYPWVYVCITV